MKCPACGADNRKGAHFCRRCGGTLTEPSAGEAPVAVEPVEMAAEKSEPDKLVDVPPEAPLQEAEPALEADEPPPEEPAPEVVAEGAAGEPSPKVLGVERAVEEGVEAEATAVQAEAETPAGAAEAEGVEEPSAAAEWVEADQMAEPFPEPDAGDQAFWREEAEPLSPVEPGTVIADRYVVVETLDAQGDEILYLAHDLQRCWQCGFEGNAPTEAFCAGCGASLDRKAEVRLLEVRDADTKPQSGEPVDARLVHKDHVFLVMAASEPEAEAPAVPKSIRFFVGQRSDPGRVRELNEDSLLALILAPTYESRASPVQGLFAVADGMGGHVGGEVASKMALQVLADRVLHTIILPELGGEMVRGEEILARLRQAIMAANDAVYLARQKAGNDMGTTLTAAFVRDDWLFLAHIGDCRAYRWNAEGLHQLTTDHSVVASMIASGQAAPEEIYTHPHRNIVYRCIGDKPVVEVDADLFPLLPGDRLIFCSDGLWEMVRSEGIKDVMLQEADPQTACDLLVRRANAAGGDDNISVMIIEAEVI